MTNTNTDPKPYFHGMLMGHGVLAMGYYNVGKQWQTFSEMADRLHIVDEQQRDGFYSTLAAAIDEVEVDNETGEIVSLNQDKGFTGVGLY